MRIDPCSVELTFLSRTRRLVSFNMRRVFLLLAALFCTSSAVAQNAAESDVSLYVGQIEALESEFGPFDRRLLEPLAGLAQLQFEQGDFEGAATLLRRQLQITRNTFGFEDPRLLPVVDALVRTEIASN